MWDSFDHLMDYEDLCKQILVLQSSVDCLESQLAQVLETVQTLRKD